jgi:hypothetical protein
MRPERMQKPAAGAHWDDLDRQFSRSLACAQSIDLQNVFGYQQDEAISANEWPNFVAEMSQDFRKRPRPLR